MTACPACSRVRACTRQHHNSSTKHTKDAGSLDICILQQTYIYIASTTCRQNAFFLVHNGFSLTAAFCRF